MNSNVVKPKTHKPKSNSQKPSLKVTTARNLHLIRNRRIQCSYTNYSRQFQIVRMNTADGDFLERALPPGTRLCFEARPQDRLEIHTGSAIASILSDRIPCEQLACLESIAS